jgi:hypothetical protein
MTRRRVPAAVRTSLLIALALWVTASVLPTSRAAASTTRRVHTTANQRGHAPFGDCPASAVHMTVTLLDTVVRRGQPVRVVAVVKNVGATACHYQSTGPITRTAPASPTYMGPCGAMPLAVYRPAHHEVWPGTAPYSCPLLLATALPAAASLTVRGTWSQQVITGTQPTPAQAPAGTYRVVVAGRFRFTVHIR